MQNEIIGIPEAVREYNRSSLATCIRMDVNTTEVWAQAGAPIHEFGVFTVTPTTMLSPVVLTEDELLARCEALMSITVPNTVSATGKEVSFYGNVDEGCW